MAFANVDAVGTIFSSREKSRGNTRVRAAKTLTPDDKPKTVWRLAKNEMMPAASVQRRRWNLKAIRFGDPSRADVARQSAHTAVHRPPLLTYLVMYWTDMDFSTQMGLCVFWVVGSGRCLPPTHPRDLRLSAAEHMQSMTSANNSVRLPGLRIPGLRASKDGRCSNARDPDGRTDDNVAPVGSLRGKKDPVHKLTKPSGHWSFFEGKVYAVHPTYYVPSYVRTHT